MVLFTDVVESTRLQVTLGDRAYDDVRRSVMAAITKVVERHGGDLIKTMGDGAMATFASAMDGLLAADGLVGVARSERSAWRLEAPLELRVGLAAGDVIPDGADVHGTPVVEAARLCSAAGAGQVLCTDVVAALVRGSADRLDLAPIGELELKGLPQPVPTVELRAVRDAPGAPGATELPAPLVGAGPFVGREEEAAALRSAVSGALDEPGGAMRRLLLVSGEPGIGKTRLVGEVVATAHAGGARVALGRCVEDLVAPFAPWAEIVATLGADLSEEEIAGHGERHGPVLERLVPSLRSRLAGAAPLEPMEPEAERRRIAEAIDDLLSTAGRSRALVVVLDDLHWADASSIAVLGHVLRSTRPSTVLLFGTYRDTDLDRTHPLAASLADLHRTGSVERHALGGLDRGEVRDLVEAFADQEADPHLVDALVEETDGNPFFVSEVLRHLAETGAYRRVDGRWVADRPLEELGLPQGVREVVSRRLSRLDAPTNRFLAAAAVMGSDFSSDVVEHALAGVIDADAVDVALEAVVRAGVIREVDGRTGRFTFSHALIRQLLLDELPGPRRTRLHWAIGDALRARRPRALDEIAYHLTEGVLAGSTEEAVDAAMAAGEAAIARSMGQQAQLSFERALATIDVTELDDVERRYQVLHGLGRAGVLRLDTAGFTASFVAAAELSRDQGWDDRFVESVISASQLADVGGVIDERIDVLLDEARPLASDDRRLAGLLIAASAAAYARTDFGEAAARAREAVEAAHRSGDLETIAHAQWAACSYRFGADPPEVVTADLAAFEEAFAAAGGQNVATVNGSPMQVLEGLRCLASLQVGDRAGFERYLSDVADLPGMNRRFNMPYWAATLASLDGRLEDQMDWADELVARFPDYAISHVCHVSHLLDVTTEREGWATAVPYREQCAAFMGNATPGFQASWAATAARNGGTAEAEQHGLRGIDYLRAGDGGSNRPFTAASLAELAWILGRPEWAELVLDELRPHLGAMITYSFGWRAFPADLAWGYAQLALGAADDAVEHMERSLALAERFDAAALTVRCRLGLVEALREHDRAGGTRPWRNQLALATEVATSLGLVETLARCRALAEAT